jgi:hypothetical protein
VVVHTCNTSTEEVEVGEQASKNCLDRQTERKKEKKEKKKKKKKTPNPCLSKSPTWTTSVTMK